jgi:ribosomal protein L11 methylase PrmA
VTRRGWRLAGAQHVVGTDFNPRAISMANFNARLNRLTEQAEFSQWRCRHESDRRMLW